MKSLIRFNFLLFLIPIIQACSPLYLLNNFVSESSYEYTNNISYGQRSKQRLDIYSPAEINCTQCPVLIFFHGGAWHTGEKEEYKFLGEAFASEGFIVVIPDFRLYPEVRFPVFIEDAAKSVRWVRDNIQKQGGNPDNINLMGHSSGAHITMMLAFEPHYLLDENVALNSIRSATGLAGPYDFLPTKEALVTNVFSTANPPEISQPINFAKENGFPVLLATGLNDQRVNPDNSFKFANALKKSNAQVKLITYTNVGHAGILLSLSKPLRHLSPVFSDSLRFIRESSKGRLHFMITYP